MSAEQISLIGERAIFRPRSRLWEFHDVHVPFDELARSAVYEQRAITRIAEGMCVAVIGPSGAGKSSVISWLCYQLPPSHVALRIPITAVNDPGNVGEVARLTLSITLDEIVLDAEGEDELRRAGAQSTTTVRTPTLVAVQTHLIEGSRAFGRLAPALERLTIPVLADLARSVVDAILARRLMLAGLNGQITDVVESSALDELAEFYRQSSGDLRRVLAAAHEAAEHAAAEGAGLIALPHVRFGIAQWL